MNLLCVILLLLALQRAYCVPGVKEKHDRKLEKAPPHNQAQVGDTPTKSVSKPAEPRHLVSWAAQLCGVAALIALQLATSE